ncbi:hypothetical protein AN214_04268 [Pseudoalteromonas sp. P1-9]|uniref:alpha-ketoglutarate-dependent dioxygenase AlkB n=1 Tax=Pseudoalteromonas sp. P1-9 TaxID=1710354 RepID=UPI0006D60F1B|nr:hypothetical protein AN214_04268 [Pseudoalteromonas sp. P1-9]
MDLRLNCEAFYLDSFMTESTDVTLFNELMNNEKVTCPFEVTLFDGTRLKNDYGKVTFMDENLLEQNVLPSEIWGPTQQWTASIKQLKQQIERFTGHRFHFCVCIYYPNGNVGVDYHCDLPAYGDTEYIASISLGAQRIFSFREISTQETTQLILKSGSLLIMGDKCQQNYEHAMLLNPECNLQRINLTFRKYGYG